MLKFMNFSALQIIGMLVFVVIMLAFIIWATGFRKKQRDIISHRNKFFIFSGIILVICVGSLLFKGINWGLDFKGGTVVEIGVDPKVSIGDIRQAINEFAAKTPDLQDELDSPRIQMEKLVQEGTTTVEATPTQETTAGAEATPFPNESTGEVSIPVPEKAASGTEQVNVTYKKCMIQTRELTSDQISALTDFLKTKIGEVQILKQETVGPTIGHELQKKALIALLIALGAQLLYITFRFGSQIRFGVAADIALVHDLIVMVGIYSLLGKPVDSSFLAALLTIIGYSVMDSVVVFDRIRENLDLMKGNSYTDTVNISLNQTMTRTALTSVTTIMTLFALYYFGGATLHNFAVALLIGAVAGTYSSLFIASPLLILFDNMAKSSERKRVEGRRKKLQEEADRKAAQKTMVKSGETQSGHPEKKIVQEDYPSPDEISDEEVDPSRRRKKSERKRRR